MSDFRCGQTAHENHLTVPGSLSNLTRGQFRDVELLVSITDVAITSNHLIVNYGEDCFDSERVVSEDEALEHVHLGTSNFIITVLLVPHSNETR